MKKIAKKAFRLNKKALQKVIYLSGKAENKLGLNKQSTQIESKKIDDVIGIQQFCDSFTYEIRPLNIAKTNRKQAYINFFVPTFDAAGVFGGIATATRIAAGIAKQKQLPLRVVCIDRVGNLDYLNKFLLQLGCEEVVRENLIDLSARQDDIKQVIDFNEKDINIATAWWTAHLLNETKLSNKYIYIIQDFEPIFYNFSDQYTYAEYTYKTDNYIPICNTKLLYDFLVLQDYEGIKKHKIFFEPAVDRKLFKPSEDKKDKKRLFIYGRPTTQRNLMVHALKLVRDSFEKGLLKQEEWEVFIAGDDSAPSIELTSNLMAKNLGKMSIEDYGELAGTIDLAVSLMLAPHPSYPPLELACSGAAVVTNKYSIKKDLKMYSNNLITVDLNHNSLLDGIKEATSMSKKERTLNAHKSQVQDNWDNALRDTINKVTSLI